ncbi:MAG TPA: adenylate kinase [Candidatus Ruania gallistercoris]|uniref:Adenylate kinase n=1 Tax=Candidatus Ruania gallistercoris TaxID=2838746 RepID=A0A9D2EIZ0_9MICO|nr:adenylate kinase [Candidatus Ruania gallistercoris]
MSQGSVADLRGAQRVLCFGATGSGKSTAAARIGTYLDLPVTLVDDICWLPGWQKRPAQEQHEIITARLDEPSWVFDSIYRPQRSHALARVDVIVALDYPRHLSLWRLLRRTVRRIRTRELVCNGNVETWQLMLARDSIIWWHFRSWRRKREQMRAWHADPDAPPVILLRHPREFFRLFAEL